MASLFISHATADDAFVRDLQRMLADHGVHAWIDSRELLPGSRSFLLGRIESGSSSSFSPRPSVDLAELV